MILFVFNFKLFRTTALINTWNKIVQKSIGYRSFFRFYSVSSLQEETVGRNYLRISSALNKNPTKGLCLIHK